MAQYDDRDVVKEGHYKGEHPLNPDDKASNSHMIHKDLFDKTPPTHTLIAVVKNNGSNEPPKAVELKNQEVLEQLKSSNSSIKVYAVSNEKLKECEIPDSQMAEHTTHKKEAAKNIALA